MNEPRLKLDLQALEKRGRDRAKKSQQLLEMGVDVLDTFERDNMNIYDPWMDDSGRFEVDPYKEYGRDFVVWLLME